MIRKQGRTEVRTKRSKRRKVKRKAKKKENREEERTLQWGKNILYIMTDDKKSLKILLLLETIHSINAYLKCIL